MIDIKIPEIDNNRFELRFIENDWRDYNYTDSDDDYFQSDTK